MACGSWNLACKNSAQYLQVVVQAFALGHGSRPQLRVAVWALEPVSVGGSGGGKRGRAGAAVLISSNSPSAQARMLSPAAAVGVSKSSNAIHS